MPTYRAIAFKGTEGSPDVVLTACLAYEIDEWSGVPQRERVDGQETIGFQREENSKRIAQIASFFSDQKNVAQNPLLCATRSLEDVTFVPDEGQVSSFVRMGTLLIAESDLIGLPLSQLFSRLNDALRERQPSLNSSQVLPSKIVALQKRLQDEYDVSVGVQDEDHYEEWESGDEQDEASDELELFTSETHVFEFWQEVNARQQILEGLDSKAREVIDAGDEFLGFSRDVLCSYLKPVLLVDGQHRLLGALRSASDIASQYMESDAFLDAVADGRNAEDLGREAFRASCRLLPVSIMMSTDVAEHVFQFVVVNQKATPVGKALLGTIVATSLTQDELETVSDRLEQVQINVTDSRAVSWFTRDPKSAFKGKVQQGLDSEGANKLPWNVLKDLLGIFRNLSGGKLPNSPRNDYADLWRRRHLIESELVAHLLLEVTDEEFPRAASDYWKQIDGPWREIANTFFLTVRDKLSDPENLAAPNTWGSTASNLYNKVSLSILVADFFQFLTDSSQTINSADHCRSLVLEWLGDVEKAYFNRDWRLSGVKKDNPGIRKRWSEMWVDYRKDPRRLPDVRSYRSALQ